MQPSQCLRRLPDPAKSWNSGGKSSLREVLQSETARFSASDAPHAFPASQAAKETPGGKVAAFLRFAPCAETPCGCPVKTSRKLGKRVGFCRIGGPEPLLPSSQPRHRGIAHRRRPQRPFPHLRDFGNAAAAACVAAPAPPSCRRLASKVSATCWAATTRPS